MKPEKESEWRSKGQVAEGQPNVVYVPYMSWTLLIISLGADSATPRMRVWRALKAQGAAVLRDGVYLLPAREDLQSGLRQVAADVQASGGAAHLLQADGPDAGGYAALFDRSAEFGELYAAIVPARGALTQGNALDAVKQARRWRRHFAQLVATDFFPGEAQRQCEAVLADLESAVRRVLHPGEPVAAGGAIKRLRAAAYRNRVWATRARPWIDRLASAWLIRRCIDPGARLLWLADAGACPRDAIGFDFDGARFTHVAARVTFETLLACFGLETPALQRLGALVHYLDVGGVQPAEASGIERLLRGLCDSITDDDQLLAAASTMFDGLLAAYDKDTSR